MTGSTIISQGDGHAEADKYLILDPHGAAGRKCAGEERVFTTARCLERAAEGRTRIVVILFDNCSSARRTSLVEFVSILKRNTKTAGLTVVAVLPLRHRVLIDALNRMQTDFVLILPNCTTDSFCIGASLKNLALRDRPENLLEEICPNLNYSAIDSQREIMLCGAYRNRMVLGGARLHNTCETKAHLGCEYYLNPRPSA